MSRSPVFTALLLVSSIASAQQFVAEVPISRPRQRAPSRAYSPRVATNGTGFLAVWRDYRSNGDLYATRLDAQGVILDPNGFLVAHGQSSPAVASMGRDYLVALGFCGTVDVLRITGEGVVGAPKRIATDGGLCTNTEVASNGENYLVVWQAGRAALLDADGNLIVGPFRVGNFKQTSAVASNGSDYIVAGVRYNGFQTEVVAVPVSRRGDVGPEQPLIPALSADVAIASNGSDYLVAAMLGGELHTRILGTGGGPISARIDRVFSAANSAPRIAWNGSEWVMAYTELAPPAPPALRIAHVRGDQVFMGASAAGLGPSGNVDCDLATLGGSVLVTWSRENTVLFRVSPDSDLQTDRQLTGAPIALVPESQSMAKVINAGGSLIATWRELFNGQFVLRASLLDDSGNPRGNPVDIAQTTYLDYQVAFDGTDVIVAWNSGAGLSLKRFTRSLQAIDGEPFTIPGVVATTLAAGNGVALVAWSAQSRTADSNNYNDIYGVVLNTSGSAIRISRITIAELSLDDHAPAAAWNGTEFLVAWGHSRGIPPPQGLYPDPPDDVLAVRVTADGKIIDSTPRTIASMSEAIDATSVASTGRNFFLAWHTRYGYMVHGRLVTNDGPASGANSLLLTSGRARAEGLTTYAQNGRYLVAWNTYAGLSSYAYTPQFRTISDAGEEEPITSLPTVESVYYGGTVAFAATPITIVAVYDRLANEPQFAGVSRVFARTVTPSAPRRRSIKHSF